MGKKGYKPLTPDARCVRVSAQCSLAAALSPADVVEVTVFKDAASMGVGLQQVLDVDREVTGLDRTRQLSKISEAEGALVAVASQGGETIGALLRVVDSQTSTRNIG